MNHPQLTPTLKQLRLSGLAATLDVRLQEAASSRLSHAEFLTLILQDELNIRQQRRIARGSHAAGFKKAKTLEDFDWAYNPRVPKKQIYDLAACQFIREAKCALFIGHPGLGKSHLAQAIGYEAIKQGFTVLRKSIFDLVNELVADEAMKEKEGRCANTPSPTCSSSRTLPASTCRKTPANTSWKSSCAATKTSPSCSPRTGRSKTGASSSMTCPSPPPSSTASSITATSCRSSVKANAGQARKRWPV